MAWGWAYPKDVKRRENRGPILAPLFICPSPMPRACPIKIYLARKAVGFFFFRLWFSLWSLDLCLFYFHRLFPSLFFSHYHSGLLFSYSNYLTFPSQEMGGQFFGNRGVEFSLVTSAELGWRWHWTPLLASLRPPSPYSSVHLRMSDIFSGLL